CTHSVAFTDQAGDPNVINLCGPFWNPPANLRGLPTENFRAGTIIHEMLHMLFTDFFHPAGDPRDPWEFRRDNSHCYKAFTLRINGYGGDANAVSRCTARPC